MLCSAARLNGLLYGGNMADAVVKTRKDVVHTADLAKNLAKSIQVLLGPLHMTKTYGLSTHLREELLNRSNMWEGDISTSESRHLFVKQMYLRATKNGSTLMSQMLHADETQRFVFDDFDRTKRAAVDGAEGTSALEIAAQDVRYPVEPGKDMAERQKASKRSVAVSLASISEWPGLAGPGAALRVPPTQTMVMVNTIVHRAAFE